MFRLFCMLYFRLTGWRAEADMPSGLKRGIVLAAPHTSNWDFWYAMAALSICRVKVRYTIKKEWMRFPFSLITKPLGGIAIDRKTANRSAHKASQTAAMISLFEENKEMVLVITPEGTRSKRDKWRMGFQHIALAAQVPVCLGYVDYKLKKAGICKIIYPQDMESAGMKEIMDFYKTIHPKYPAKFSTDKRYA